jgi:protein-disulfide isomerase
MSKRFLIIMAALVVLFIGVIIINKNGKSDKSNGSSSSQGTNYTQGAGKKGVTLVEFGDFQCPACGTYYPIAEQVKQKYINDITFQFRHFPLVQIHPNAMVAHRAAEAAGRQDKFWEMYSLLYTRQQNWVDSSNPTTIMDDYATELGLNIDKFKSDFSSADVNDAISADIKLAQEAGANGTPTFVLDGKKLDTLPQDLTAFSKLIDEAIANKN